MLIDNLTFSALDIFKLKSECGKRTNSWIFPISALTAPHKYGYGEYPVASPDMVSLGDISINMQGFARYPLVKAHGKETVFLSSWRSFGTSACVLCVLYTLTQINMGICILFRNPDDLGLVFLWDCWTSDD